MGVTDSVKLLYAIAREMRFYQKMIRASSAEIRDYQSRRLCEMVTHAYENVPVYHQKYKAAGIHPDDIQTIDDLSRLPVMTRKELCDNFPDGILARNYKKDDCIIVGTTGSSGTPVKIFRERAEFMGGVARFTPNVISEFFDRPLNNPKMMTLFVRDEDAAEEAFVQGIPKFLRKNHSAGDALDDPLDQIKQINETQPDIIASYPSVLRNIAATAQRDNLTVEQPTFFVTTAEMMDETTRDMLKESFPTSDIISLYGATEGFGGVECHKHEGFHVFPESYLEIVDEQYQPLSDGMPGRILMTNLRSMATPIIRYTGLGDVGTMGMAQCSCGVKLPLLARIEGRMIDSLTLPDNRVVHPFNLTLEIQNIEGIQKFQIRQDQMDEVKILIVESMEEGRTTSRFTEGSKHVAEIVRRFGEVLGKGITITVQTVADIPRQPGSHKYAVVVSSVSKQRYQNNR